MNKYWGDDLSLQRDFLTNLAPHQIPAIPDRLLAGVVESILISHEEDKKFCERVVSSMTSNQFEKFFVSACNDYYVKYISISKMRRHTDLLKKFNRSGLRSFLCKETRNERVFRAQVFIDNGLVDQIFVALSEEEINNIKGDLKIAAGVMTQQQYEKFKFQKDPLEVEKEKLELSIQKWNNLLDKMKDNKKFITAYVMIRTAIQAYHNGRTQLFINLGKDKKIRREIHRRIHSDKVDPQFKEMAEELTKIFNQICTQVEACYPLNSSGEFETDEQAYTAYSNMGGDLKTYILQDRREYTTDQKIIEPSVPDRVIHDEPPQPSTRPPYVLE